MSQQQQGGTSPVNNEKLPWQVRSCRWLWQILLGVWGTFIAGIVVGTISNLSTTSIEKTGETGAALADVLSKLFIVQFVHDFPFPVFFGLGLLALFSILSWLGSRWHLPALATALPTPQGRKRLINRLRVRYKQIRSQSLQGVIPVELGLVERRVAIHNAASLALRLPEQPDQVLPPHTSIVDIYTLAQQELLILGKPGAGKSTLLLELACHLVEQAERDIEQPLPVLFPLSSWGTNRRPLQDWLIEQFALLYDIPRSLSKQWVQAGLILPLLDGLDEMDASAHAACIAAINTYHRDHLHPLVVCSRTTEYDRAAIKGRLVLHTAIVVQPLSRKQVDTYLDTLGEPFAALRTMLRKNPVLRGLATTPLMLHVLILTYRGRSIQDLPKMGSQKAQQQQIFTHYVERMVERKGNKASYSLKQMYVYLGWLAQRMRSHNQTVLFLEQLQPDWLPNRQRFFFFGSVVLTIVLITLLFEALVWLLIFGLPMILLQGSVISVGWLLEGLLGTFPQALTVGLIFGSYVGSRTIQPSEVLTWSWSDIRSRLFIGLLLGLTGGAAWIMFRRLGSKVVVKQLTKRLSLSPNEGIRRSAQNGLLAGIPLGLLVGVFYGLFTRLLIHSASEQFAGPFGEVSFELGEGLLYGLLLSLMLALIFGLGAFIQHYTLRFWLWYTHLFPWRAVSFLEDATARVLLQRIGGGYSFTHRLLLDYFANQKTPPPDAPV